MNSKKCDKTFHKADTKEFYYYFSRAFGYKNMDELNKNWPYRDNPWKVASKILDEQEMWMGKCPGKKVCPVRRLESSVERWKRITTDLDMMYTKIFHYKGKCRGQDIIVNTDINHTYARYCDECQFYKYKRNEQEYCKLFKKYLERYDGPLQLQECYDECELESSEIIFYRLKKEYENND